MNEPKITLTLKDAKELLHLVGAANTEDNDTICNLVGAVEEVEDRQNLFETGYEVGGVIYTKPDHIQFCLDAEDAGLDVKLYHGRFFYHGPSVTVERVGDFQTSVKTQQDNMGLDMVVYCNTSDSTLKNARSD